MKHTCAWCVLPTPARVVTLTNPPAQTHLCVDCRAIARREGRLL